MRETHNVFTKRVNKIALSTDDAKRIKSIISTETYAYRKGKDLACKNKEIKCGNIKKEYKSG